MDVGLQKIKTDELTFLLLGIDQPIPTKWTGDPAEYSPIIAKGWVLFRLKWDADSRVKRQIAKN